MTASKYPELFHAYVGIGQVAGVPQTQQVRYQFAESTCDHQALLNGFFIADFPRKILRHAVLIYHADTRYPDIG